MAQTYSQSGDRLVTRLQHAFRGDLIGCQLEFSRIGVSAKAIFIPIHSGYAGFSAPCDSYQHFGPKSREMCSPVLSYPESGLLRFFQFAQLAAGGSRNRALMGRFRFMPLPMAQTAVSAGLQRHRVQLFDSVVVWCNGNASCSMAVCCVVV